MKLDPVDLIEACYAPVKDDQAWLELLLEAAAPLDLGMGAVAAVFTANGGTIEMPSAATRNLPPHALARVQRFWEVEADPELARSAWRPPVRIMSRVTRHFPEESVGRLRTAFREAGGVRDALGVIAIEPDGQGVIITVPAKTEIKLPPRAHRTLRCISAHLLSARRLRARTERPPHPEDEGVEAVLDPAGRFHHATGEAAARAGALHLASRVKDVERARGRLRRTDPDEAVALWKGLVGGRWSLVDHIESDGRRFVLARRNEPGVRDPKALAPRERDVLAYTLLGHSNKYIAYSLGIAPSTVAFHLTSAMAKLQVKSRRELITAFAGP